jgi:hypothetical protein
MTERYVGMWMAEGRHYRINFVNQNVDNIHLRIASDIYLFIQRTHELGTGLLSSIVALASFAYVLWGVSAIAPLPIFGVDLSFPGYLIWIALAYAAIGTAFAHLIGRKLIPLNFNQQRREADFRFAIARVTDYAEPVALMRGEAVERHELRRRFSALVANWTQLVSAADPADGIRLRLRAHLHRVPDSDRHAGLSRRRHAAGRPDAGRAGVPARRRRVCVLPELLQQDRRVEGDRGPAVAVRSRHEGGRQSRTRGRHDHVRPATDDALAIRDLVLRPLEARRSRPSPSCRWRRASSCSSPDRRARANRVCCERSPASGRLAKASCNCPRMRG